MLEKNSFSQVLEEWKKLPISVPPKVYQLWIKKIVSVKDWVGEVGKAGFESNSSYCFLNKDKNGITMAFLVANPELKNGKLLYPAGIFPSDCLPLTDEEALQVDSYRRGGRIYPFPCEVV